MYWGMRESSPASRAKRLVTDLSGLPLSTVGGYGGAVAAAAVGPAPTGDDVGGGRWAGGRGGEGGEGGLRADQRSMSA